jgi:CIC family chloride channel protein
MIPLMIVSSISFAISKRFEKHSMDVKKLAKKGHAFTSNKDSNVLSTLDTNSIIQTDYLTVSPNENLDKLVDLISNSTQVVFAVVNLENELVGVVYFNDIKEIIFNTYRVKYTQIKEIMSAPKEIITPEDSMEMVMDKFEQTKVAFLPVLKNDKYYGFISKSLALEAYRTKLKYMTIE